MPFSSNPDSVFSLRRMASEKLPSFRLSLKRFSLSRARFSKSKKVKLDRNEILSFSEYLVVPKYIRANEWISFISESSDKGAIANECENLQVSPSDRFLGRLSQGNRRKLNWISAHLSKRPIVLMDEPFNGLDFVALEKAKTYLRDWSQRDRTILLASHQLPNILDLRPTFYYIKGNRIHTQPCPISNEELSDLARRLYLCQP